MRRVFLLSLLFVLLLPIYLAPAEESNSSQVSVTPHSQSLLEVDFNLDEIAYLADKKSLNVCIDPDWMPYEKNANGKYVGLTADYMKLFEKALGIPIILAQTKTWSESLAFAKSHQCDFVSAVAETPEKSQYLDFTNSYFSSALVVATDVHKPWVSNILELEGKKLAVVKGYAIGDFIKAKYPKITLIEVASLDDGLKGVVEGKLYGYIGTLATVGYNIQKNYFSSLKIGSKLQGSWDLNVGVRKDEPILTDIMNKIISAIPMAEHQKILNNWVSVSVSHEDPNELTKEEKHFLELHPILKFGVRPNRPPFEFNEGGVAKGIAVDYIKEIGRKIGFTPKFVFDNSSIDDFHNQLEIHESQIDTLLYSVINEDRAKRFNFGESFLSYPVMVMVNKSTVFISDIKDLNGKTVAMEKSFVITDWIKRDYPQIIVKEVLSTEQALYMVESEQVDAYIGNLAIANYMIAYGLLTEVKIGIPTKYKNIEYRFIAPKYWPELTNILDKGFRSLSPSQHSVIQQRWYTLQTVEKQDYTLAVLVLITAGLITIWFYWSKNRLSAAKSQVDEALKQLKLAQHNLELKNIELERLSVTDKLTGIYNRVKLEATLAIELNRAARYGDNFAVILVDLDHFKRVNDTLGHQAGDLVLQAIAQLFKSNIRTVDTFGRWGGEEFLVICPHSMIEEAEKLAEHLRRQVQSYDFGEIGAITASFGVTAYRAGDSSIDILGRADEALYKSKEAGRNTVTLKS